MFRPSFGPREVSPVTVIVERMRVWRRSRFVPLALAAALVGSCTTSEEPASSDGGGTEPKAGDATPEVPALDLWAGVPPIEPQADDIAPVLEPRPGPAPPPTVHETIEAPFPAPGEAAKPLPPPTPGPLTIERHGPTGEQGLVDAIRLSFSQPMVPLADVTSLSAVAPPLTIDPALPGEVKWLGTRTAAFMPEGGRLPFSTEYTITVPAGTASTWGGSLARDFRWTVSTPTLALVRSTPREGTEQVKLEPTLELEFNQEIERTALVAAMTLSGGGDRLAFKLAPPPATSKGSKPAAAAPAWKAARQLRVVPERPLRPNTRYTLKIPAGVYGEGPRKSKPVTLSFRTYAPLRLTKAKCYGTCWASAGISLLANNLLSDPDVASKVHVDPEPDNFRVDVSYTNIQLSGDFEGRTRYKVTVDAGLTDSFGQALARDFKTAVTLGPPYPSLSLATQVGDPVVIESAASKDIAMVVSGLKYVELEARSMPLDEVPTFLGMHHSGLTRGWPRTAAPSTWRELFRTPETLRKSERRTFDLSPALGAGKNHLWLIARSNPVKSGRWTDVYGFSKLVEITDLGVAAALGRTSGLAMVTRLSSGEPVEGAELAVLDSSGRTTLWTGRSDAEGRAELSLDPGADAALLTVKHAGDSAALRLGRGDLRGRWRNPRVPEDQARAFFYTDRTPYKPGDTVHLSGILRDELRGPDGKLELWRPGITAEYTVTAPRGVEVAKGTVKLGNFGTFSVDIPTKEEHGTGNYQFQLKVGSLLGSDDFFFHSFPVETYRAPEFTVAVERPTSTPLVFGDTLTAEIRGEYLHGAPLIGADVHYVLKRSRADFTPPGALNEGFTFGTAPAWGGVWRRRHHFGSGGAPSYAEQIITQGPGELDPRGVLTIERELLAVEPPPEGSPPPPAAKTKDEGPPRPATFTLEATVTDKNRQAIAGRGSFVVHAARVYAGLRSDRTVLREGERAKLQAVLVDLEGERVAGKPVQLKVLRRETTRKAVEKGGRWVYQTDTTEHEAGGCALTSGPVPAACEVDMGKPGTYVVRAEAEDDQGHATRSELTLYVHGKEAVVWESTSRRVDLVPDRRAYQPGDTATVLVRSPFDTARGVVVLEREGIKRTIPVVVEGGAATVEVPVDDTMIPSARLSALLTRGRVEVPGAPKGQDLGMPASATGQVRLEVNDDAKRIEIALEPGAREIGPGESMTLQIRTTAAQDGSGLPAAVALMVVDEGVLSLMGHKTPDPLAFFHRPRAEDVWLYALHAAVLSRDTPPPAGAAGPPEEQSEAELGAVEGTIGLGNTGLIGKGRGGGSGYGRGSGAGFGGRGYMAPGAPAATAAEAAPMPEVARSLRSRSAPAQRKAATGVDFSGLDAQQAMAQPVSLREVFATTAYFNAEVLTDAEGNATVEIPMPENLTTFRVMAVAVDPAAADRFGHADTTVRVRKPLMLRPSLPRFANLGDRFEASVMVDNQTGGDQAIMVGTRGTNVSFPAETQKMVEIPAGESREVRFDMAVEAVGTMRLQFAALSNGGRDATELSLPVHYPATAEAFADYGMIDTSTQRSIAPPADALRAFGGLELSFSSTALSGLEDAVDYLVTYPYECAEQTASRVLPIFALSDILDQFPVAGLRDKLRRDKLAEQGLKRLLDKQNYDGGFGYWTRGESWPYLTNWVTLALLEGKRAGFKVDDKALDKALHYVENFVTHGHRTRWGVYYDWTSRAVGLWLLSGRKRGAALFDRVWAHRKDMPLYARALLMAAAHRYGRTAARDTVLQELRDGVIESPRAVHFAEGNSEAEADGLRVLMHSSVQTDAIALMALLEVSPADPMLPKVMAGIMSGRDPRQGGRWGTTHANAWALLAADRYFETVEADEPDYTARVWLDEQFAGEHAFKGRSMRSVEQRVPMSALQGEAERSLVLQKEGAGKLYYRMGLRYAPEDLKLPAQSQGFLVYREYEALPEGDGEPDTSAVQKLPDGGYQVKAGTNVKVTLTVVARDRANYVVIDDALPAGFEGQNPRFLTSVAARSEATRTRGTTSGWWWPWWRFDHTDLRDDRMLLFADRMPAGVYTYSYTARATTIGTFHLPPIKAEAMYEPERFGHSASATVRVVE